MNLLDICNQTGLNLEDARLMLINVREDWVTTETITNAEADLIRQSARAALPGNNVEITPVAGMDIASQELLIDNASQILNFPLVLAMSQELKAIDTLAQIKNAIALNIIDRCQVELDEAIKERSKARQAAYLSAIQELADTYKTPVSVEKEMADDIKVQNAQLDAILLVMQKKQSAKA